MLQDSDRSSSGSPEPASGSLHEHQLIMESMRNSRKRRRSPSPKNMDHAKRAAVAQAHLNGTSTYTSIYSLIYPVSFFFFYFFFDEGDKTLDTLMFNFRSVLQWREWWRSRIYKTWRTCRACRRSPHSRRDFRACRLNSPTISSSTRHSTSRSPHRVGILSLPFSRSYYHNRVIVIRLIEFDENCILRNFVKFSNRRYIRIRALRMWAAENERVYIIYIYNRLGILIDRFAAGTVSTTPSCTTAPMATLTQLLSQPQPVAMPQFIMTSGQLVQGIQGAQLLIPTSQGKKERRPFLFFFLMEINLAFNELELFLTASILILTTCRHSSRARILTLC